MQLAQAGVTKIGGNGGRQGEKNRRETAHKDEENGRRSNKPKKK
jgi:hypothetical protein